MSACAVAALGASFGELRDFELWKQSVLVIQPHLRDCDGSMSVGDFCKLAGGSATATPELFFQTLNILLLQGCSMMERADCLLRVFKGCPEAAALDAGRILATSTGRDYIRTVLFAAAEAGASLESLVEVCDQVFGAGVIPLEDVAGLSGSWPEDGPAGEQQRAVDAALLLHLIKHKRSAPRPTRRGFTSAG